MQQRYTIDDLSLALFRRLRASIITPGVDLTHGVPPVEMSFVDQEPTGRDLRLPVGFREVTIVWMKSKVELVRDLAN